MILVTGAKGQLGSDVSAELTKRSIPHIPTDADTLDITDKAAVEKFFSDNSISSVIHCAAYTAVDKAETEISLAYDVNAKGAEYLAKYGKRVIYISTDYVFDGNNDKPYVETDTPNPISVYGGSKLEGEKSTLEYSETGIVIRTSWLYSSFGYNFVKTMLKLAQEKDKLNIVSDQIGTPTYARDLARAIKNIILHIRSGEKEIYNFSNEGVCSWYDFATEIVTQSGLECKINPIESKDYSTLAKRPSYSVLSKEKIKKKFNIEIPDWKESLKNCLDQF